MANAPSAHIKQDKDPDPLCERADFWRMLAEWQPEK